MGGITGRRCFAIVGFTGLRVFEKRAVEPETLYGNSLSAYDPYLTNVCSPPKIAGGSREISEAAESCLFLEIFLMESSSSHCSVASADPISASEDSCHRWSFSSLRIAEVNSDFSAG